MRGSGEKLAKVSDICLALPSAERSVHGSHATYRVRGKVFAYFLDDHHGDGIVSVCVKSELGENVDRARRDPERFYLPAYIGPRGWFGLRLDRGRVDWREVANVVERSYRLTAPKTLVARVDSGAGGPPRARASRARRSPTPSRGSGATAKRRATTGR
jgi:phosphoribosylglycinamide formyltransferase-1